MSRDPRIQVFDPPTCNVAIAHGLLGWTGSCACKRWGGGFSVNLFRTRAAAIEAAERHLQRMDTVRAGGASGGVVSIPPHANEPEAPRTHPHDPVHHDAGAHRSAGSAVRDDATSG